MAIMKTPPQALVVRWRGELSARGGAVAGAVLGFLMAMSYNLAQFGTIEHWTLQLTLVGPLITAAMVSTAGADGDARIGCSCAA